MQNNLALYLASKPFLFIYSCNYSFFFLKLACDLTLYLQCTQPCLFPRFHCSQSVKKNVLFRRMKATGRSSVCCSRLWTDAEFSCWAGLWDWWEHLDPRPPASPNTCYCWDTVGGVGIQKRRWSNKKKKVTGRQKTDRNGDEIEQISSISGWKKKKRIKKPKKTVYM